MPATTAILLFSRSAEAEAAAKGFGSDYGLSLSVASALLERTRRTLSRSGLPVYQIDETAQHGDTFGQRITHAALDVFRRGYERILVVGNDCPQLQTAHLRHAARLLAEGRDVIGPDGRGGAWMIGLRRDRFDAATFAELEWKTGELLGELTAYYSDPALLRPLSDVNFLNELRAEWYLFKHLVGGLFSLLFTRLKLTGSVVIYSLTLTRGPHLGRAPPGVARV